MIAFIYNNGIYISIIYTCYKLLISTLIFKVGKNERINNSDEKDNINKKQDPSKATGDQGL